MTAYKLTLEVPPCKTLAEACWRAQDIADKAQMSVEFQFNSVICVAVPGGEPELLMARQYEASNPEPPRVTSAEKER